uniref:Uncharacterized protein n=1 Tax=Heliothis virescens TaxID=7102 RepID=A0A2A4K7K3_HELVI
MLRKVFYSKNDIKKKRKIQSTSAPILVSDASVADLYPTFRICSPSKNSSPRTSTSSSSSRKGSPRSCLVKETRECGRMPKKSLARCVQIRSKDTPESPCPVEQLYFNDDAKKSCGSSPRRR